MTLPFFTCMIFVYEKKVNKLINAIKSKVFGNTSYPKLYRYLSQYYSCFVNVMSLNCSFHSLITIGFIFLVFVFFGFFRQHIFFRVLSMQYCQKPGKANPYLHTTKIERLFPVPHLQDILYIYIYIYIYYIYIYIYYIYIYKILQIVQ